jgi:hypothetical protein
LARSSLDRRANLALCLIERVNLGERAGHKQELALAEAEWLFLNAQRGGMRAARCVTVDVEAKIVELVENKITQAARAASNTAAATIASAKVVSEAAIDSSYATALAVVVAMGLSAARTTTLTNMLIAMRDSNKSSASTALAAATTAANECATAAATQAANESALKVLNETERKIRLGIDETGGIAALTTKLDELSAAIKSEGERLGIRI